MCSVNAGVALRSMKAWHERVGCREARSFSLSGRVCRTIQNICARRRTTQLGAISPLFFLISVTRTRNLCYV